MKKLKSEKETAKNTRSRLASRLVMAIVILLVIIQIIVSNSLTTSGDKLEKIEEEISRSTEENKSIEKDVNQKMAFQTILEKAGKSGFTKNTSVIYLSNLPLALTK